MNKLYAYTLFAFALAGITAGVSAQTPANSCAGVGAGNTITVGGTCGSGTITDNTLEAGVTSNNVCGSGQNIQREGWFRFQATATSHTVTSVTGNRNGTLQVFSGACGSLTQIGCANATTTNGGQTEQVLLTGLTIGTFYYIRVGNITNNNMTLTSLCITSPPANDNCSGAIVLTPGASCVTTAGTSLNGTQSLAGCTGTADDDVWYSFVATGSTHYVTVAPSATYNAVVEVFSGTCGSLTSLQCINAGGQGVTENVPLTGLTAGQTYYIRVYHNGTGSGSNTFTICVTNSIPCVLGTGVTNVASLPYSSGATTTCGMVNDITSSNVTNICGSSSYYGGEDAVYIFTPASTGTVTINHTSAGSWVGIMLYQGCPTSGGTCVTTAQSSAGNQSLCANVTAGQTYYLVVDVFPSPTCNPYTLTISAPTPGLPPGTTCSNPVNITLPYSATGESTSCMGDDYTNASLGSCGTLYESGEDKVYQLVTTSADCINIEITGATSDYIGVQVYQGCPGTAGTTCIASYGGAVTGTLNGSVTLPGAGTYYIIVDSWSPPVNVGYNIAINSLGGAPANDLPCNAILLTLGTQVAGDNSCSGGSGEPAPGACWTNGNVNTVWYRVVCPASGQLRIRTNPGVLTNTQINVYSGACGSLTAVAGGCNDNAAACGASGTNGSEVILTGLTPGNTYWIAVDGYGSLTGSFSIIAIDGTASYPPVQGQDCVLPNPVCNQTFTVSNPGYSGFGNNCDLPGAYCLASAERNVVWYTIPINAAGTLSFDLVPNDFVCATESETDYDFAVWRLDNNCDGSGADGWCCTEIFNGTPATVPPIACNYSFLGVTGMSDLVTGNAPATLSATVCPQCSSCGGYSPTPTYDGAYELGVTVAAGEVYILAVSNFSSSTSGFHIDFRTSPIGYVGSSATSVTWTGGDATQPTAWADADNWGGCNVPSCTVDAIIAPFSNQPVISANTTVRDLTIQAGASLTINAGVTVTICGNFSNLGTLNMAPTATILFNNTAAHTMSGGMTGSNRLGNLTVNQTAGSVTINNPIEIAGNFTTSSNTSIFNTNGLYVTVGGNFTNANGNTTFSNTGTTGTLEFNGTGVQNYNQGTANLDLNNVIVNNTGGIGNGVNLLTSMYIKPTTGTLTLNTGTITTGAGFIVHVNNSTTTAVNTGNATSFVDGNLNRVLSGAAGSYDFPVGNVASGYQRANINFTTATTIPRLQANFVSWPGVPPTQGGTECGTTYNLATENNGYWVINASANPTSGTYTTTLYPTNATNTAGAASWTVIKSNDNGATWTLNGTCAASTSTVVTRTGMNGFSWFAAGQGATPLPIELLAFDGHAEGYRNKLEWTTASEQNNEYFTVERSEDGVQFEEVGRVPGAGNSNSILSYYLYDEYPFHPLTYYRLKQTDYDGQYSYSPLVSIINTSQGKVGFQQIYPNPSLDIFNIVMISEGVNDAQLQVMDLYGKTIMTNHYTLQNGEQTLKVDGSAWASGVYFIRITSDNKMLNTIQKVIRE